MKEKKTSVPLGYGPSNIGIHANRKAPKREDDENEQQRAGNAVKESHDEHENEEGDFGVPLLDLGDGGNDDRKRYLHDA